MQVSRTQSAQCALDKIWDYIAKDNSAAADRVLDIIGHKSLQLAKSPAMGEACPQIAEGLRQSTAQPFPYVIFYRPTDDGILIVRVLHGHRDVPAVFAKEPFAD